MTRRTLTFVLAGAAAFAIALVLLVSSVDSDSATHVMSDGSSMDGSSMTTQTHTMPGGEPMDGAGMMP